MPVARICDIVLYTQKRNEPAPFGDRLAIQDAQFYLAGYSYLLIVLPDNCSFGFEDVPTVLFIST